MILQQYLASKSRSPQTNSSSGSIGEKMMYSSNQNFNMNATGGAGQASNLMAMRTTQGNFELPPSRVSQQQSTLPPSQAQKSRNLGLPQHLQFKTNNPVPSAFKSKSPEYEMASMTQT